MTSEQQLLRSLVLLRGKAGRALAAQSNLAEYKPTERAQKLRQGVRKEQLRRRGIK